jgi:hypothetical protein
MIYKVSEPEDMAKVYDYLSNVKETIMSNLAEFMIMCMKGRVYAIKRNNNIKGALCMYETKEYVFVAHMYVNKSLRHTKQTYELYKLICKYGRDKSKDVFTLMEDATKVKSLFTEVGKQDGMTKYQILLKD